MRTNVVEPKTKTVAAGERIGRHEVASFIRRLAHAMGHAGPRTTQRYDRDKDSRDRDPSFLVAAATSGS